MYIPVHFIYHKIRAIWCMNIVQTVIYENSLDLVDKLMAVFACSKDKILESNFILFQFLHRSFNYR